MTVQSTGDLGPQRPVCIFCLVKRDRRTGRNYQNCDLCVGRDHTRWCECPCAWLTSKGT